MEKSPPAEPKSFARKLVVESPVPPNPGCVDTMEARGVVRGRSPAPLFDRRDVRMVRFAEVNRPRGEVSENEVFLVNAPDELRLYGEYVLRKFMSTFPKTRVLAERLILLIFNESAAKL